MSKINFIEKDGRKFEKIYDYEIEWPEMPPKRQIANYSLPPSRQKFTPTPYLKSLFNPRRDEFGGIIYSIEEQNWISVEFDRIVNGYWFYNNGQATYITGYHYFELSYWQIDVGLKEYRDRDRRFHMVWQFCEDDPNCFGLIYMKHRREGATHRACCLNYLYALYSPGGMNGIQSKSGTDAQKVFAKLTAAWRKLRPFLMPIFSGTSNPKKELPFSEPAEKQGKTNRKVKSSEALDSKITWATTVATAYDGDKLSFAHIDEIGKWTEEDAYKTWQVIRECLAMGNKIVGKSLLTSTVEEMEKGGGRNFKRLWDESDIKSLSDNKRSTSGLYRLFFPAYDGLEGYIDQFGMGKNDEAKAYLDAERKQKKKFGDAEGLSSFKRKYPYTESDALIAAGVNCEFNLEKIEAQREWLDGLPESDLPYVVGNLMWEEGIRDSRVVFKPSKHGRWKIAWRSESEESMMNKVKVVGSATDQVPDTDITYDRQVYKPDNTERFVLGVDPYDFDKTKTGRGSKGAGYVIKKFDVLEQDDSVNNIFASQYLHRPPTASDFYEDMILTCMWFGCQMLFEDQKQRIKNYFIDRRYHHFLMVSPLTEQKKREKRQIVDKMVDVGQSASRQATQQIAEHWESYIENHWEKIYFPELLEDLIQFDPFNTEKSDATMASGYALIASKKYVKKRKVHNKEVRNLLPLYNHSGIEAKRVKDAY